MTEIKLDAEAINAVVMKVVLDQLTTEKREEILGQAVAYVLQPKGDAWRGHKTPLQDVFDAQVTMGLVAVVQEVIAETPEFRARVRALVVKAMADLLDSDAALGDAVGTAVGSAVSAWAYERRS